MKSFHRTFGAHLLGIVVLIPVMVSPSNAATLNVGAGLDPSVPGNYLTISEALAVAVSGDVIMVGSGYYPESITINNDVIVRGAGTNLTKINLIQLQSGGSVLDLEVDSSIQIYGPNTEIVNVLAGGSLLIEKGADNAYVSASRFGSYGYVIADDVVLVGNEFNQYLHFRRSWDGHVRPQRAVVTGNVIFVTYSNYTNPGSSTKVDWPPIYFEGQSNGIFQNNLIIRSNQDTNTPKDVIGPNSDWVIRQNTFTLAPYGLSNPTPSANWKNNIVTTPDLATIDENGNLVGDAKFTDPSNSDYTLAPGSPAIDAGIGFDPDGSQADLGYLGGTGSSIFTRAAGSAGRPEVGHLIVQPDPVAPGESIRLRFEAHTN